MTTASDLVEARSELTARRTRGLMAELRYDQQDVARAIGLTQPSMSRRVNGLVPFAIDEVDALADFLGVSPLYLLGYTNDRGAGSPTGA